MKTTHSFYDFRKDVLVAEITEKKIAKLLETAYNLIVLKFNKNKDYDIVMKGKKTGDVYTFEVKEDFTHARTGNIGVEFESWGKASGIQVSKADFYVFVVHNADKTSDAYIIETAVLKSIIKKELYSRIVVGGDVGSESKNYLFEDTVFFQHAKKLMA